MKLITKNINVKLLLLLILLASSCKDDKNDLIIKKNRDFYLDFYFPDTVNIKNTYEGKIIYKSPLDTITKELFKEGDSMRILALYLKNNKMLIKNDYEHILNSKELDTFVPYTSNDISFNHKFNNLGINYLEGVLKDEIYFKDSDTSKLRIITKFNHITLPVYVTDDENLIDSYFKEDMPKVPMRI